MCYLARSRADSRAGRNPLGKALVCADIYTAKNQLTGHCYNDSMRHMRMKLELSENMLRELEPSLISKAKCKILRRGHLKNLGVNGRILKRNLKCWHRRNVAEDNGRKCLPTSIFSTQE